MPVRKIPKNYLTVTGSFSSKKNGRMLGFESLLERDYMILLEFDDTVQSFEEQPVKIPFKKGIKPYVPDILVHYAAPPPGKKERSPLLAEVKHTSDLERNHTKYVPKFEAGRRYAQNLNWVFRTVTEKEIRISLLNNYKFLREYLHVEPDPGQVDFVLTFLREEGPASLDVLLSNARTLP